jgi:hypothetical protein
MANPGLCMVCTGENIFESSEVISPGSTAMLAVPLRTLSLGAKESTL